MARNRLSKVDKAFVKDRANGCCEYCKFPFEYSHDAFHYDHIIPPDKGGTEELDNIAYACDRCNSKKWTRIEWNDPDTGQLTPLFHPRKDIWGEHFSWNHDISLVNGLTPKGKATIFLLEMNRPGLINVRKALYAYGIRLSK
jgi:hypothetical protein